MSKITVLECDECGTLTDDLNDKEWAHFPQYDVHYCAVCKMEEVAAVDKSNAFNLEKAKKWEGEVEFNNKLLEDADFTNATIHLSGTG